MSSTVPTRSPKRQMSPMRMTSSPRIETPPKRFSSVFCAAKAMAIPPMPSPASRRGEIEAERAQDGENRQQTKIATLSMRSPRIMSEPVPIRPERSGALPHASQHFPQDPPQQPVEADDRYHSGDLLVAMPLQHRNAKVRHQNAVGQRPQHQPQRPHERTPRLRRPHACDSAPTDTRAIGGTGPPAIPGPRRPESQSGSRATAIAASPQKLVAHQEMRKMSFHLMHRGLLVELGEPGQSVGGDEPDASAFRHRRRGQESDRTSTSPAFRLPTRCLSSGIPSCGVPSG